MKYTIPVSIPMYAILAAAGGCSDGAAPQEPEAVAGFDYVNWSTPHGDDGNSHYSSLDQINRDNVDRLEVAWEYRSGGSDEIGMWWWTGSTIETNPIVIDGVLYTATPDMHLVALDAGTGLEIWRYNPFGDDSGGGVNRGVVYWAEENGENGRIFYGVDEHLHAVDAKSGKPAAGFGEGGRVLLGFGTHEEGGEMGAPGAPVIYKDHVIVGENAGHISGNVSSYDVRTGKRDWSFRTIPVPGETGYDSHGDPDFWKTHGAANVWSGLAVDPLNEMLFFGTGSPEDDFYRPHNAGQQLFGNSVVALDANTGKYLWHHQDLHHDLWDLDLAAPPILATFVRRGKTVPGLIQLSKTGNTYLFNRLTGELLSDVEERPAPPSTLEGETAYPTQPVVHNPEPFTRVFEVTEDELTDISAEAHAYAVERFRQYESGWFLPPSEKGVVYYGVAGGAEWPGGAYDPERNTIYVNGNNIPHVIRLQRATEVAGAGHPGLEIYRHQRCVNCHGPDRQGVGNLPALTNLDEKYDLEEVKSIIRDGKGAMPPHSYFEDEELELLAGFLLDIESGEEGDEEPEDGYVMTEFNLFEDPEGYPATKPPWATLNAIDVDTGKIVWQVPLGEHEALTRRGVPQTGTMSFGGPVVTAGGIVFIGSTQDEKFRAFDKDTGEELWETILPFANHATPSTYMVDGRQYVVVPCGGGGKLGTPSGDAWVAFALPDNE